ncbi:MAG: hypothetical protein COA99_11765 [Moraxellaceae bacterium]|nr:MAG: hypothetical protein COA99_11765 [Moraxellaceae bacterium]
METTKSKNKFLLLMASIVCVVVLGFYATRSEVNVTTLTESEALPSGPSPETPFNLADLENAGLENLDLNKINAEQEKALEAVQRQVGVKETSGKISERPDFISPIEWRILKWVAEQKTNSDEELTKSVNHLRFAKQEELWDQMFASQDSENTVQRHALANQLLSSLPARVANQNVASSRAQRLQSKLLHDLVSDPDERRLRIAKEAKRIGITFTIEKNSSSN